MGGPATLERARMRLVMTLLVRDEQDIVRANLEHHLAQGVDHVVVTDNLSVDGTREILEEYAAAGVATIIDETDDDYDQSAWVSRMARAAVTDHGADWVINNDADEFWFAEGETVATHLAALPADVTVVFAPRYDLIPVASEDEPWHERLVHRWVEPLRYDGHRLPGKVCHRGDPDVAVAQGNHRVTGPSLGRARRTGLHILHAPIRSYEGFRTKVTRGGAAYERNTKVGEQIGRHWRELHQRVSEGSFDDWWRRTVVTHGRIEQLLADERIVEDDRLRRIVERSSAPVEP